MTLVIAHRGASGWRPEHTAAAVRLGFALGAGAVEPDLVPSRDGVLVIRHEPEISETTDVAARPEFAARRRTVRVPAEVQPAGDPIDELTGWFTFDFSWAELATLRARERLPGLRQHGATFTGEPLLRLADLLDLLDEAAAGGGERPLLVAEIKHAAAFQSLGFDMAALLVDALADRVPRDRLVVESFELPVLLRLRELGLEAPLVLLAEERVELDALPAGIDGVSCSKAALLAEGGAAFVAAAQARGLLVYVWTLRPENAFLEPRHRGEGGPGDWGRWQEEFREVLATGVDGVFADHPDLVAGLLLDPDVAAPDYP